MKYARQRKGDPEQARKNLRSGRRAFLSALLVIFLFLPQCKQPYVNPHTSPATGYLVIEGYISGNTPTQFMLSRTIKLSSDTTNPREPGASVQVEGSDNSTYPLTAQGGGLYATTGALPLNTSTKYRLHIKTQSGEEYLSDYVPYKITPAIDSINWIENADGVTIYTNTHDNAANTKYYQWNFDEVWEYHAALNSLFEYVPSDTVVIRRPPQDQTYRCWQAGGSSNILIASSAKLSSDVIYKYPINEIPVNSVELGVLYSILVRQYALTDSGYNYLTLMQKNTESLGTIFDPQPSQLNGGNIHSLSNSAEPVIGYVFAGSVQQQRIFIDRSQLTQWTYSPRCDNRDSVFDGSKASLVKHFGLGGFVPLDSAKDDWIANLQACADCALRGGNTVAPAFWPN